MRFAFIEFDDHRQALLEELEIGGRLEQVPSWTRLRDNTRRVIAEKLMIEKLTE